MKQKIALCAERLCALASRHRHRCWRSRPRRLIPARYPGPAGAAAARGHAVVRSTGLEPSSPPMRFGPAYVAARGRSRGREVRVIADARTGRILKVIPITVPRYAARCRRPDARRPHRHRPRRLRSRIRGSVDGAAGRRAVRRRNRSAAPRSPCRTRLPAATAAPPIRRRRPARRRCRGRGPKPPPRDTPARSTAAAGARVTAPASPPHGALSSSTSETRAVPRNAK